jgi:hypothetical protein
VNPGDSSTAHVICDSHRLHLVRYIVESDSKFVGEHSVTTSSACTDLVAVRKGTVDVQYSVSKPVSFSQLNKLVSASLIPPEFVRELSILKSSDGVPADNHSSSGLVNKSRNTHLWGLRCHSDCILVVSRRPFSNSDTILSSYFNNDFFS